jgi:cyclopropane-fatty-acyl-phospholipid synthase
LRLNGWGPLAHLAGGQIGRLADDYVEGQVDFDGSLRALMAAAAELMGHDPREEDDGAWRSSSWWGELSRLARSRQKHGREADARQVRFHYDVSDDFYQLWLDPRRVYSCAYFRAAGDAPADPDELARAQEAKLDHVCRKLMLREGERFLDVGAGWGGLLLWAAERYGAVAHGITLSRNQHAHVNRLIDERGLRGRVSMELVDYRDLHPAEPFDKIASVGMFEHVGRARLPEYFGTLRRLLRPGGLLLNHGITAGGTRNAQLGAGIGDFIERHVFPGGELMHVSHVIETMADAALEPLDIENLRPHYARTLWAWSDGLEARLDAAREAAGEPAVRVFRMYLAGCALAFEHGWILLHQMLAARPSGQVAAGPMRGAQCDFPFRRDYMYR